MICFLCNKTVIFLKNKADPNMPIIACLHFPLEPADKMTKIVLGGNILISLISGRYL